jgi:nitrite reductase/ring-hydroxylating ferredoxin subunit
MDAERDACPAAGAATWHPVCPKADLRADGSGRAFEIGGRRVALFLVDGAPRAIDDECPHEGASLADGVIRQGEVTCPWHSFHFDLATGANADGLALEVAVHAARVNSEGVVEVGLVAG